MSRGTGRGSVFTRIQKVARKGNSNLPVCSVCKDCKDQSICENRTKCNICIKCQNCKEPNDCDRFYFYKRNVGEFKNKNNKIKPIYSNKKSEVNKELSLKIAEVHQGKFVTSNESTLEDLMTRVVENRRKVGKTKGRAYLRNKNAIKSANIMPMLKIKVQEITNNDIINSFELITFYSQSIIDKIFGLVNSAFKFAIAEKIMYFNPLDNKDAIQKPKSKKQTKDIRAFTIKEQKKFFDATYNEKKYGKAFRINLGTGLRPGELLALKPTDYNKKTKELHICRTLTRDENDKPIVGDTTKTYSGDRYLPVTDEFEKDLLEAIDDMIPNENDFIFTHENGKMINPVTYNTVFKRICSSLQIMDVTAYTIRHSFATRRVEAHMDIKLLAQLMGHKDTEIIYKNYVTIQEEFKKSEQKRYERYMKSIGLIESEEKQKDEFNSIVAIIQNFYINEPEKFKKILFTVNSL